MNAGSVLSKATMDKPVGENMGPANLYGMLTIIATILTLPFAFYFEGPTFLAAWKKRVVNGQTTKPPPAGSPLALR